MKNSLKGALLSGLAFPGLGQVVLKKYKRGIALMLMVFASLIAVSVKAVQQALAILETLQLEGGVIDIKKITDAAARAAAPSDSFIYNFGLSMILACWVFGIVDAYRIGREKDLENSG